MTYTLDDMRTVRRLYDFACASMPPSFVCPDIWPGVTIDDELPVNGRFYPGFFYHIDLVDWGTLRMEAILVHEFVHYICWMNDNPMEEDTEEDLAQDIERRYLLTTQVADTK